MFSFTNKKGFTLVELMVVISIIGLLTAIILPSFNAARKTSRVGQRVSNMKQVQAALEFYYSANHAYPSTGGQWFGTCSAFGGYAANAVVPGLVPTYIAAIPTDPQFSLNDPNHNCYIYRSDGIDWAFVDFNVTELFVTQSLPNMNSYPELIDPARDGGSNNSIVDGSYPTSWKVSSPGAISW